MCICDVCCECKSVFGMLLLLFVKDVSVVILEVRVRVVWICSLVWTTVFKCAFHNLWFGRSKIANKITFSTTFSKQRQKFTCSLDLQTVTVIQIQTKIWNKTKFDTIVTALDCGSYIGDDFTNAKFKICWNVGFALFI